VVLIQPVDMLTKNMHVLFSTHFILRNLTTYLNMQDIYLFILVYKLAHVINTPDDCVIEIETCIDGQVYPQA
jgi:hypothetical protein